MDFDKFKPTKKISEIFRLLETIQFQAKNITIWQNLGEQERIVYNCYIDRIDKNARSILIKVSDPKTQLTFEKNITVYIHSDVRSMVFKSENFIAGKSSLLLKIPSEVRVIEMRDNPRFNMQKLPIRTVLHRKETGLEGSGNYRQFSINCYDISQSGMSLELQSHHLVRYQIGDQIEVKSIINIPMENIKAEILYICPLSVSLDGNNKSFKAGLRFERLLDSELLKQILVGTKNAA